MTRERKYRKILEQIRDSCLTKSCDRNMAVLGFYNLVDLAADCLKQADKENFDDVPV